MRGIEKALEQALLCAAVQNMKKIAQANAGRTEKGISALNSRLADPLNLACNRFFGPPGGGLARIQNALLPAR